MAEIVTEARKIMDERLESMSKEISVHQSRVERAIAQRPFAAIAFAAASAFFAGAIFGSVLMRRST